MKMKILQHGITSRPESRVMFCPECATEVIVKDKPCYFDTIGFGGVKQNIHYNTEYTIFGRERTRITYHATCPECKCEWVEEEVVKTNIFNKHRVKAWIYGFMSMVHLMSSFIFCAQSGEHFDIWTAMTFACIILMFIYVFFCIKEAVED